MTTRASHAHHDAPHRPAPQRAEHQRQPGEQHADLGRRAGERSQAGERVRGQQVERGGERGHAEGEVGDPGRRDVEVHEPDGVALLRRRASETQQPEHHERRPGDRASRPPSTAVARRRRPRPHASSNSGPKASTAHRHVDHSRTRPASCTHGHASDGAPSSAASQARVAPSMTGATTGSTSRGSSVSRDPQARREHAVHGTGGGEPDGRGQARPPPAPPGRGGARRRGRRPRTRAPPRGRGAGRRWPRPSRRKTAAPSRPDEAKGVAGPVLALDGEGPGDRQQRRTGARRPRTGRARPGAGGRGRGRGRRRTAGARPRPNGSTWLRAHPGPGLDAQVLPATRSACRTVIVTRILPAP